jgi:hypothetical protein
MHRHGGVRAFWPRMRAGRGASALGGRGCDAMRIDDLQLRDGRAEPGHDDFMSASRRNDQ